MSLSNFERHLGAKVTIWCPTYLATLVLQNILSHMCLVLLDTLEHNHCQMAQEVFSNCIARRSDLRNAKQLFPNFYFYDHDEATEKRQKRENIFNMNER